MIRNNNGFSSFSEIAQKIKPKKGYPVQDSILYLATYSGLSKGIVFKLWSIHGNEFIFETESKYKQGEIKNLKAFLLSKLKRNGIQTVEN
jgi:hypothetical protein